MRPIPQQYANPHRRGFNLIDRRPNLGSQSGYLKQMVQKTLRPDGNPELEVESSRILEGKTACRNEQISGVHMDNNLR